MENTLKFNNGKFTIMSLGDLHENIVIENRDDRKRLEDMHNLVDMGIKAFKPDLIVLMGDTCCQKDESEGFTVYKEGLKRALKPVIESGIPFCWVFGNHEHDAGQEDLIKEAYSEIETCLSFNDEKSVDDLSYNLLVKDSDGKEDILNLWFIDSNNCAEDRSISHYDWVHEDQIKWYEDKAQEIKEAHGGKTIPALLFQHIPVYEEYELLREATLPELPVSIEGIGAHKGKHYVLKDGVDGYLGEPPCSPDVNGGQFESWKKTGDVKAAFFGHDHTNDFSGEVDGILLSQNKTSGFRAYTDGCRCGVRITTVHENEPEKVHTKMYHFKELGLECHCLGPIMKRITDRQSMNMHKAGYAAAAVAGIAGAVKIIKTIKK